MPVGFGTYPLIWRRCSAWLSPPLPPLPLPAAACCCRRCRCPVPRAATRCCRCASLQTWPRRLDATSSTGPAAAPLHHAASSLSTMMNPSTARTLVASFRQTAPAQTARLRRWCLIKTHTGLTGRPGLQVGGSILQALTLQDWVASIRRPCLEMMTCRRSIRKIMQMSHCPSTSTACPCHISRGKRHHAPRTCDCHQRRQNRSRSLNRSRSRRSGRSRG